MRGLDFGVRIVGHHKAREPAALRIAMDATLNEPPFINGWVWCRGIPKAKAPHFPKLMPLKKTPKH